MNEHQQISLNNQEFVYDLDPDLIFNFNHDHVEFVYTSSSGSKEITETILAMQLSPKKKLNIQSVLCCRTVKKTPMLIIIAIDPQQINHIFCYNVLDKQLVQVLSKNPIEHEITQTAITRDPFDVVFLSRKYSNKESCHALVIGTIIGNTTLVLINIDEATFEAKVLSTEKIKNDQELGYVSSIHILPPDKVDRRVGHSDPQILLGYSKGAILIYRFRANVYSASAERLRHPVNLFEFAEYPNYPITCLSCARPSDSLVMTVAFAQEKPIDNPKYQYSHPYIKLIEIHGDSSRKQRKIINPPQPLSTIMEAKLSTSTLQTLELESIMQLSIIFQKKDAFELSIWHVSPKNVHLELTLELDQNACLAMMNRRNKLRSDDLIGYYKHTPQKLVQRILQHETDSKDEEGGFKRKHDDDDEEETIIVKKGKIVPVPVVVSHSDEEEPTSTKEQTNHDQNEDTAMENVIPTDNSTTVKEEETILDSLVTDSSTAEDEHLPADSLDNELAEELEGSTIVVESVVEDLDKASSEKPLTSNEIVSSVLSAKEATILVEEESIETITEEPVEPVAQEAVIESTVELPASLEEDLTKIESIIGLFGAKQPSGEESIVEEESVAKAETNSESRSITSKELLDDGPNEKLAESISDLEALDQQEQEQGVIGDDYVFVDMKDVPEDLTDQGIADKEYNTAEQYSVAEQASAPEDASIAKQDSIAGQVSTIEQASTVEQASIAEQASITEQASIIEQNFIAEQISIPEQASVSEQAFIVEQAPIAEQHEELRDEQTPITEQHEEFVDENDIIDEQEQDFTADDFDQTQPLDEYDEEMDYGQDYVDMDDDAYNEPRDDTEAEEVCVLLSSDDNSDDEENQDDYDLEEDENTLEKENRQPIENYSEEGIENDYLEEQYEEEIPTTTTRDDLSDVGSIQQSFVPAGSTCSTNDEVTTPVNNNVPTIDYIPVMQQDLLRLLQDAGIPSSTDMGTNQDAGNVVDTSFNINATENENDGITLSLPTEMTQEEQHLRYIEQAKLDAEKEFSDILSKVIGHGDIDTFMNQALPQDQLDEIGSACWLDSNPRLRLMMVRYCDKYKMVEEVVTLCKGLQNADILSSEEDTEWKNIYKKYLSTYSSFANDTTINIFTSIGRRQLLDKEAHHIKLNTFTSYNDSIQKRHHQDYMQYYGFGACQ